MKHITSILLAALAAVLPRRARLTACNSEGEGRKGSVTRKVETAALLLDYQLMALGTDPALQVVVADKGDLPLFVTDDPAAKGTAVGDRVSCLPLGLGGRTAFVVADEAIAAGSPVYGSDGGKVDDTATVGSYLVGYALEAAAADGDIIEIVPIAPVEVPA